MPKNLQLIVGNGNPAQHQRWPVVAWIKFFNPAMTVEHISLWLIKNCQWANNLELTREQVYHTVEWMRTTDRCKPPVPNWVYGD